MRKQRLELIKKSRQDYKKQNTSKYSILSKIDSRYPTSHNLKTDFDFDYPSNNISNKKRKQPKILKIERQILVQNPNKNFGNPAINFLEMTPSKRFKEEESYESVINYKSPIKRSLELRHQTIHESFSKFEEKSTKANFNNLS